MLPIAVFVLGAQASIIQYGFSEFDCDTAPSTILQYSTFNDSPTIKNYTSGNVELLNVCSEHAVASDFKCCRNSLYPNSRYPAWSTELALTADSDLTINGPAVANGATYCDLTVETGNFKFNRGLFRTNNVCLEDYFRCSYKLLVVYQEPGCKGNLVYFALTNDIKPINTTIGNFKVSQISIKEYAGSFQWSTYYPGTLFVPAHRYAVEYIGTVLYSLIFIWILISLIQFGIRYRQLRRVVQSHHVRQSVTEFSQTTARMHLLFLALFGIWSLNVVLEFTLWYIKLDPSDSVGTKAVFTAERVTRALSTLLVILVNIQILIQVYFKKSRYYELINYGSTLILISVHIGMIGWSYIISYAEGTTYYQPIYSWAVAMSGRWSVFFFSIDAFIPLLVLSNYYFCRDKDLLESLSLAIKDKKIIGLFIVQIFLFILYNVFARDLEKSPALGNDYAIYTITACKTLILTAHIYMSVVGYGYCVRAVIREKTVDSEATK